MPHRKGIAQALAAFALLALAVRALVPAGYMVAPSQNGRFLTVALCSGQTQAHAVIDLVSGAVVDPDAHEQSPASDTGDADAPCVFAAAAPVSVAPLAASIAAPPQAPSLGAAAVESLAPGRGLAAPPPWSTGPPLSV
ncbi:MAG: hypothetical protein NW203_15245 [Hyphomonadaceae bacterium]|nr:hypothetical protein [Hyphomonadaceae bacterium]